MFVPRQRTTLLVDEAVALGRRAGPAVVVVDLCCGAGALGLATAVGLGGDTTVSLHASDVDPAAVACAARNVAAVGGTASAGDLFDPLPPGLRGRVDLLLANVPYVPTTEIALLPREARDHEAHVALDGGGDGLDVLRRVAAEAPAWLAPGGHLLTESGERQAAGAVAVLNRAGLVASSGTTRSARRSSSGRSPPRREKWPRDAPARGRFSRLVRLPHAPAAPVEERRGEA